MAGPWYKDYYLTTPEAQAQILAAITTDPDAATNMADVQRRLSELQQIPEERCSISSNQRHFLNKVVAQASGA